FILYLRHPDTTLFPYTTLFRSNGTANAEREIKFWRDGLARTADLAFHREPAFIADGARGGDFRPKCFRERFRLRNVFPSFDAAANGDNKRCLREVDGGFGLFEQLHRLRANLR